MNAAHKGCLALLASLLIPLTGVRAQQRDTTPCCLVVRVDTAHAVITARETATGYTFRVEVRQKKVLAALKIGDKVWANFAVKKVRFSIAGDSLCCAILEPPARGSTP